MAPEYAVLGQLSEKVDVYSFGVVCLEIISGRKNIDANMPTERMYLSHMVYILPQNYDHKIFLSCIALQVNQILQLQHNVWLLFSVLFEVKFKVVECAGMGIT